MNDRALLAEEDPEAHLLALSERLDAGRGADLGGDLGKLRGAALEREGDADRIEAELAHPPDLARQLPELPAEHRVDERGEAVLLGRGADRGVILGGGGARRGGVRADIERELVDLGLGEAHIEPGGTGDAFGKVAPEPEPGRVRHPAHRLGNVPQLGLVEHRHQGILALFEQLGGARLVGGAGGDDEHRRGLARTGLGGLDQELQRIMRLVAAGAHPDVARPAEQRGGARLVAEQGGVAPQVRTRDLDPLARVGQGGGKAGGGGARPGLVGPAEEEDPALGRARRKAAQEVGVPGLHG